MQGNVKPIPKDEKAQKKYEQDIMKPIIKRIIEIRKGRGLNQEEMANMVGLSLTGYAAIEQGKTFVSIPKLFKLREMFNTTFGYILEGKDSIVDQQTFQKKEVEIQHLQKQNALLEKQVALLEKQVAHLEDVLKKKK